MYTIKILNLNNRTLKSKEQFVKSNNAGDF